MRLAAVAIAVAALVAAVVVSGHAPDRIALHEMPQGVAAFTIDDVGRVFVLREGLQLFAVRDRTRAGHEIVWCPREQVFWAPQSLTIYDRYGHVARVVAAGRDPLVPVATSIDGETLLVSFGTGSVAQRPEAVVVARPILDFYERWLSRDQIPGGDRLRWCPNPLE